MNIYQNRSNFKLVILVIAVIIGAISLYFTRVLVDALAVREQEQIKIYAEAIEVNASLESPEGVSTLLDLIIRKNQSIPVVLASGDRQPISDLNLGLSEDLGQDERMEMVRAEMVKMQMQYEPIVIEVAPGIQNYVFYRNSYLITQLTVYPYVQLTIIIIFILFSYLAFSFSKRSEQNRVWVGLAKETAHQLGTPLSSLMAWIEYFNADERFRGDVAVVELEKDVQRLQMITERFSNIGSVPTLKDEPIQDIIRTVLDYLERRVSTKVALNLENHLPSDTTAKVNRPLFEWVIENLVKNAVDAMGGRGSITIDIHMDKGHHLAIDVADTGKGIPKSKFKRVFDPGFTTKKRGWGLGLTLVKRIVEEYHQGKIYVKESQLGKGTTFRIILNA